MLNYPLDVRVWNHTKIIPSHSIVVFHPKQHIFLPDLSTRPKCSVCILCRDSFSVPHNQTMTVDYLWKKQGLQAMFSKIRCHQINHQMLGGKPVENVQIDPQTTAIWPKMWACDKYGIREKLSFLKFRLFREEFYRKNP